MAGVVEGKGGSMSDAIETTSTDEAKIQAEIGALTGAAAAVRDLIRLSWLAETVSSAELQEIAESYGLIGVRPPSDAEVTAGACEPGDIMIEMTPVFAEIVDNLDEADAHAADVLDAENAAEANEAAA